MSLNPPLITVFIVHWNRPSELINCLRSLLGQTNCRLEVVVYDNNSKKDNLDKLKSSLPALPISIQLIEGTENLGWGKALNQMLKPWLATSSADVKRDFCVISAHDALLSPNCIETLLQSMQADERIGIVSPDHERQSLKTVYSPLRGAKATSNEPNDCAVEDADYAHGTLFMLRRQCLEGIGLFDERFFAYGDEVDLSLRARANNWRVVVCHQAKITNPISGTAKKALFFLDTRNSLLLAQLHGNIALALLRGAAIGIKTIGAICTGQDKDGIQRAKLMGIQCYLMKKWGPPPEELTLLQNEPTHLTEGSHD